MVRPQLAQTGPEAIVGVRQNGHVAGSPGIVCPQLAQTADTEAIVRASYQRGAASIQLTVRATHTATGGKTK
jgi:hypothetical protein